MPHRHAMNWGLLLGLVFSLGYWLCTFPALAWIQYIFFPIEIFIIYRLTVHCRETECNGTMSYGQSLWYIVQLVMYASLILALFVYLHCKVLNPDYIAEQLAVVETVMETMPQFEDDAESFQAMTDMFGMVITPLNMAIAQLWVRLMEALFVGLILSAFIKRDKTPFDGNETIVNDDNQDINQD